MNNTLMNMFATLNGKNVKIYTWRPEFSKLSSFTNIP